MHMPCRTLFVLAAMASIVFPVAAAPSEKPSDSQIARWIKELGSEDFDTREKASRQLWLAGEAAKPALEKALRSGDLEVVRRAHDLLDKFRWGIYGDTPPKVVALIQAYQAIDVEDGFDDEIVEKLIHSDIAGLRAFLLLAKNDNNFKRRNRLRELVSPGMFSDGMPGLLQRVFDKVEDKSRWDWFINLAHDAACLSEKDFAAYWLLRGQLDDRIRDFRARLARAPSNNRTAYTLAHLYRAKGDFAEARKIAEKEKFAELLEDLLLKMADWKTLAALPKPMGLRPIQQASYRASFARLSGNRKQFEAARAQLKEMGIGQRAHDAALALLANGCPEDGITILANSDNDIHFGFIVLCARLQYREAMALVDRTPANVSGRKLLEIHQARMWYHLGEPDKGRALFTRLGEQFKEEGKTYWSEQLLRVEQELGLNDLALEHCARLLPLPPAEQKWTPRDIDYLAEVFRGKGNGIVWFPLLRRKFREESDLQVLRRVSNLFDGKIAKATVKEWIEEAQKELGTLKVRERSERLLAFAEVAAVAGLNSLARSLLEKADTPESCLRLGDLLAGKREWMRAAECYRQAWRKDLQIDNYQDEDCPDPLYGVGPLPLYLAGDALVKAGREREGKRLIEQAHLAPLGDGGSRYGFFEALRERGHREAARREYALTARLGEANSPYCDYAMAMYHLAPPAAARKDYFQAARAYEQAMFSDLSNFGLVGVTRMSSEIHRLRVCGLLAAGKHEDASREIELALIAWPANTEVANALVPELERRGRKKEADALFNRCLEPHEKTCREYPRCAVSHNNAAWMMACCRRNLDKALEHAEKAIKLKPTNAGYFDTLAEVHFQRGDKDKAIAAVKRAIELDPKKRYYRHQLKRLEAGDPSAERPSEDED